MTPTITIFVSSPGDVAEERAIAQRVIERLQGELHGRLRLQPIFWEHEPLLATATFQDQIVQPSDTDIVVCILWSRLGTRLPKQFMRPDGSRYDSGTEYEFEDAVNGRRERGKPDLVVYRKLGEPVVSLRDRDTLLERLRQKELLESFFARWFKDEEEGTLTGAFHAFEGLDRFEQLLELHLRKLVEPVAAEQPVRRVVQPPSWQQGSPFRGLEAFGREHAAVFFGRTRAIGEVLETLRRRASEGAPFVLITGMSGCGKSSLARAGVVPLLTQPGVIEGVGHWRVATLRPGDAEEGEDLLAAFARSLTSALPEIGEAGTDTAAFGAILRASTDGALALMRSALTLASEAMKRDRGLDARPDLRVCLVLDQLEEAFTAEGIDASERDAFFGAVEALVRSGIVWAVATLRSDYYPRCADVDALMRLKEGGGQYDLSLPSPAEIGQIIRQPAVAAGLRFDEDPRTGTRLEDLLRDAAVVDAKVLPLLEFTLEELYRDRTEEGLLQLATYQRLGGVVGALARRAEEVFQSLSPAAQAAFPVVLRAVVTVGATAEDAAASRRADRTTFTEPAANEFIDAFVAARLLVTDLAADGGVTLGLAHEALLRHWPRLTQWLEADHEQLRARARLRTAAGRWVAEGRTSDFLLQPGKPLAEARALRDHDRTDLTKAELEYIRASVRAGRNRVNVKRIGVAALAGLTVLAVITAVIAGQQRTAALNEARTADRVQQFMVGLFEPANPEMGFGSQVTASEMLDIGVVRAEQEFADEPAAQARLYVTLGRIQLRLGRPADAEGLYESALALRLEHFARGSAEVAEARQGLAQAYVGLGRPAEAEPLMREVVAARRRLGDDALTAEAVGSLGNVLSQLARYPEAEEAVREALTLRETAYGEDSAEVAASLNDLASARAAQGDRAGAVALAQRSVEMFEAMGDETSPWLARARGNLAFHLQNTGRHEDAEAMMRSVLERDEARYGADHPIVATDLTNLASVLELRLAYAEAEPLMQRAHDIHVRRFGEAHPDSLLTLNNLAGLYRQAGDVNQALPLSKRAVELSKIVYGADHPDVGTMQANLAAYLTEVGALDEARPLLDEALRIHLAAYGEHDPRFAITLGNAATWAHESYDYEQAEALHRQAIAIYTASNGADSLDVAFGEVALASVLADRGKPEEALPYARHALDVYRSTYGTEHPEVGRATLRVGQLIEATEGAEAAEPVLLEAYTITKATAPPGSTAIADVAVDLANARVKLGRPDDAVPLLEEALALQRAAMGERSRAAASILMSLGAATSKQGDHAASAQAWGEAAGIMAELEVTSPLEKVVPLCGWAEALADQDEWAEAEVRARRGLEGIGQVDDESTRRIATAWLEVVLGRARLGQGDRVAAARLIRGGHRVLTEQPDDNPRLAAMAERALRQLGDE